MVDKAIAMVHEEDEDVYKRQILSLESVVSVLAGWVILGETLNLKEILGCVLVFAAVILVQLPEKAGEAALSSEV